MDSLPEYRIIVEDAKRERFYKRPHRFVDAKLGMPTEPDKVGVAMLLCRVASTLDPQVVLAAAVEIKLGRFPRAKLTETEG